MGTIRGQGTGGIAVVSVLALAATACHASGPGGTGGDYPYYSSAEELFGAAGLVVEGTVEGSRTGPVGTGEVTEENLDPSGYTVYALAVSEVFRGEVPDGVLEVKHPVGQEDLELREGSAYVLFLEAYGEGVPPSLVNPDQGAHLVGDDGSLEPVGGSLEVGRGDLG